MTDREVIPGCTRVRTKCAEKTSVDLWGQSRDPRELPGVTAAGPGVGRGVTTTPETVARLEGVRS